MLSFGAVPVSDPTLQFYSGIIKPISERFQPEALAVNKIDRVEALVIGFDPKEVMLDFENWLKKFPGRPVLVSDNNGFDSMFISWYFNHFIERNPFGHSSRNLGDLYKGLVKNVRKNFKHLRQTRHTHHPVDDARGNVEALNHMTSNMGLRL